MRLPRRPWPPPPVVYTVAWTDAEGRARRAAFSRLHVAQGHAAMMRTAGHTDARILTQAEARQEARQEAVQGAQTAPTIGHR